MQPRVRGLMRHEVVQNAREAHAADVTQQHTLPQQRMTVNPGALLGLAVSIPARHGMHGAAPATSMGLGGMMTSP